MLFGLQCGKGPKYISTIARAKFSLKSGHQIDAATKRIIIKTLAKAHISHKDRSGINDRVCVKYRHPFCHIFLNEFIKISLC